MLARVENMTKHFCSPDTYATGTTYGGLLHFIVVLIVVLWLEASFFESFFRCIVDLDTTRTPTKNRRWVNLFLDIFLLFIIIFLLFLNTRDLRVNIRCAERDEEAFHVLLPSCHPPHRLRLRLPRLLPPWTRQEKRPYSFLCPFLCSVAMLRLHLSHWKMH